MGLGLGVLGLVAVALMVFSAARPAGAAFPGRDGRIAFDSNRSAGDFEIYATQPGGSDQRQLTDNDALDYAANFSPSGRRIAFESNRDGDREIFVMRADGSHQRQLTQNDDADFSPAFSPSGKRIVFDSALSGNGDVYVMRADGSHQHRLTFDPGTDEYADWGVRP